MTDYYSFHTYIQEAYIAVHEWLGTKSNGYKDVPYPKKDPEKTKELLQEKTLKSAAAQYYFWFPTHYFKVIHTLENIITRLQFLSWIKHNQHICLIDVGCGAGAATAAFLETIIRFREEEKFTHSIEVLCLGIEPNQEALAIYKKLVTTIGNKIESSNIKLTLKIYPKKIQEVASSLIGFLNQECEKWQQPCITDAIIMQSNIVSALEETFGIQKKDYERLLELDIEPEDIINNDDKFGIEEARAYKWLLEDAAIDNLHSITIGTVQFGPSVKKMGAALDKEFSSSNHSVKQLGEGTHKVYYENPLGSYWREKKGIIQNKKPSNFHVDARTITSEKLQKDEDWKQLINLENLEKAWVYARDNLLKGSFVDEVEVRLFERNINQNLIYLQKQLMTYVQDVAKHQDYVPYKFVKNSLSTRPKGLQRLEEEILSVAVIQNLGKKAAKLQGNSYAYRFASEYGNRESLYESWFRAYNRFLADVRTNAKKNEGGVVVRLDVESFYTKIIQDCLVELTQKELTESDRVRWLIKLLLSKNLDEHELGYGITQGSIGSGFYANLYLTPVDIRFGCQPSDNEWEVQFARYLDDMILVVPDATDVTEVLDTIKYELTQLGLKFNEEKTEIYDKVSDFLEAIAEDDLLKQLSDDFFDLVNFLWICNSNYRHKFEAAYKKDDDLWWHLVEKYQKCLKSISIYVEIRDLSRKICRYLLDWKQRDRDLKNRQELKLPKLLDFDAEHIEMQSWADIFHNQNKDWVKERDRLSDELAKLFIESFNKLKQLEGVISDRKMNNKKRKLKSRMRFAFNKLSLLGLIEIKKEIVDILCKEPWILREAIQVLDSLARQGFVIEIVEVIAFYQDSLLEMSEYIRAVALRAIRFLPETNEYVWNQIVKYSTTASLVERLMATETWLYLGHLSHQFVSDRDINAVLEALHAVPPPTNRLKKNYLLILALYDNQAIFDEPVESNNLMLKEARNLALEGSAENLFGYYEPQILRNKYYSKKRQTDSDRVPLVSI